MHLYSRTGACVVQHEGVTYLPDPDGGFPFPDHVSDVLHPYAVRGERMWETSVERQRRVMTEEMERRRDPAELYAAVEKIMRAAETAGAAGAAKPSRARTPAEK